MTMKILYAKSYMQERIFWTLCSKNICNIFFPDALFERTLRMVYPPKWVLNLGNSVLDKQIDSVFVQRQRLASETGGVNGLWRNPIQIGEETLQFLWWIQMDLDDCQPTKTQSYHECTIWNTSIFFCANERILPKRTSCFRIYYQKSSWRIFISAQTAWLPL